MRRYTIGGMVPDANGNWVSLVEYNKIQSENSDLKMAYAALKVTEQGQAEQIKNQAEVIILQLKYNDEQAEQITKLTAYIDKMEDACTCQKPYQSKFSG